MDHYLNTKGEELKPQLNGQVSANGALGIALLVSAGTNNGSLSPMPAPLQL